MKKGGPYESLYRAVAKYVEANGGKVVVAGGVQLIQHPEDGEHLFTIGIRCTGRKPIYPDKKAGTQ